MAKKFSGSGQSAPKSSAPPEPPPAPSILDLLASAGPGDLSIIDAKIAGFEEELETHRKRLSGEIASLSALRKLIDLKLNGKPARKPRSEWKTKTKGPKPLGSQSAGPSAGSDIRIGRPPLPATADDTKIISRIVRLLVSEGPMSDETISGKLGEPLYAVRQSISRCSTQVKRFADGRAALPGHAIPDDD